jgi:hypothetical protein
LVIENKWREGGSTFDRHLYRPQLAPELQLGDTSGPIMQKLKGMQMSLRSLACILQSVPKAHSRQVFPHRRLFFAGSSHNLAYLRCAKKETSQTAGVEQQKGQLDGSISDPVSFERFPKSFSQAFEKFIFCIFLIAFC